MERNYKIILRIINIIALVMMTLSIVWNINYRFLHPEYTETQLFMKTFPLAMADMGYLLIIFMTKKSWK